MMKKIFLIITVLTAMMNRTMADSGTTAFNVVIDTDGALDDLRAINMFLAGKDFTVLGITSSQGTLKPGHSFDKVSALLCSYFHNGIPAGAGSATSAPLPLWSDFANSILWAGQPGHLPRQNAFDVIEEAVSGAPGKITLVALGPLTNYAQWIKHTKQQLSSVERIVWYGGSPVKEEFNYICDPQAYADIIRSGIPLTIVSKGKRQLGITNAYRDALKSVELPYSKRILDVLDLKPVQEKIQQGHAQLWDDLVPLYLSHPDLFDQHEQPDFVSAVLKQDLPESVILSDISQLFHSKIEAMNRVFRGFPLEAGLYKTDYSSMLGHLVSKYGIAEWKAITITNEVHGHTGIYSIIGAKAGIRACEYYNVGVNQLYATSFAGNKPPLSCFNDGIQISTGATIGQGLIRISDTVSAVPTVIFRLNNRAVKLTLHQAVAQKMQQDIRTGIEKYGMSAPYWQYVETLAKKYWTDLNRHDIFVVEKL